MLDTRHGGTIIIGRHPAVLATGVVMMVPNCHHPLSWCSQPLSQAVQNVQHRLYHTVPMMMQMQAQAMQLCKETAQARSSETLRHSSANRRVSLSARSRCRLHQRCELRVRNVHQPINKQKACRPSRPTKELAYADVRKARRGLTHRLRQDRASYSRPSTPAFVPALTFSVSNQSFHPLQQLHRFLNSEALGVWRDP